MYKIVVIMSFHYVFAVVRGNFYNTGFHPSCGNSEHLKSARSIDNSQFNLQQSSQSAESQPDFVNLVEEGRIKRQISYPDLTGRNQFGTSPVRGATQDWQYDGYQRGMNQNGYLQLMRNFNRVLSPYWLGYGQANYPSGQNRYDQYNWYGVQNGQNYQEYGAPKEYKNQEYGVQNLQNYQEYGVPNEYNNQRYGISYRQAVQRFGTPYNKEYIPSYGSHQSTNPVKTCYCGYNWATGFVPVCQMKSSPTSTTDVKADNQANILLLRTLLRANLQPQLSQRNVEARVTATPVDRNSDSAMRPVTMSEIRPPTPPVDTTTAAAPVDSTTATTAQPELPLVPSTPLTPAREDVQTTTPTSILVRAHRSILEE